MKGFSRPELTQMSSVLLLWELFKTFWCWKLQGGEIEMEGELNRMKIYLPYERSHVWCVNVCVVLQVRKEQRFPGFSPWLALEDALNLLFKWGVKSTSVRLSVWRYTFGHAWLSVCVAGARLCFLRALMCVDSLARGPLSALSQPMCYMATCVAAHNWIDTPVPLSEGYSGLFSQQAEPVFHWAAWLPAALISALIDDSLFTDYFC